MNHHHHQNQLLRSPAPAQLVRYESAPSSFFADLPPPRSEAMLTRFFAGSAAAADSNLAIADNNGPTAGVPMGQLERSYGVVDVHVAAPQSATSAGGGTNLVRHSSLPAGFMSNLLVDQGCSGTRGFGSYPQVDTNTVYSLENRRLRSQWSFSRHDSLSQISELGIPEIGETVTCGSDDAAYISSQLGTWDNNPIVIPAPNKRAKDNNSNIVRSLSNIESQFSLPGNSLDYLKLQPDSVPCRVRAKRGCATHPRSIAERDRRTRISRRLQKLQDLVPNIDKQTSTSDMLELAVKHISELQNQLQRLKQDQAKCTCGGNQVTALA